MNEARNITSFSTKTAKERSKTMATMATNSYSPLLLGCDDDQMHRHVLFVGTAYLELNSRIPKAAINIRTGKFTLEN